MTLNTQELCALLEVFQHAGDLDALSELIEYDVYELKARLMTEMSSQVSYELECQ